MEYVNAIEGAQWRDMLMQRSVSELMHEQMMSRFNQYALIGGMPEAVSTYAEYHDIERLSPIFNSLLKGYNEVFI